MTSPPILSWRDLNVTFDASGTSGGVLRGLTLDLAPGEAVCLVGASGAGKSIAALATLRLEGHDGGRRTGGQILLRDPGGDEAGDTDIAQMNSRALRAVRGGRIGMIFQDPGSALNPVLTIGAQLTEALRLHARMTRRTARAKALSLLRDVQMPAPEQRLDRYPHELSGGMRQRAMIALALAGAPDVLIADEPTTALDARTGADILALLDRLRRERGLALLLITHDMGVVARIADRVVVLDRGRIIEQGPVATVLEAPRHEQTQRLVAAAGPAHAVPAPLPPNAPIVLEARGITLRYAHPGGLLRHRTGTQAPAVRDVSMRVGRGETLALVGESGSGKSSLARVLMQLEQAQAGDVLLQGSSLRALSGDALRMRRRALQMVFQDPLDSFDPRLRLGAQIDAVLRNFMYGTASERRARVEQLFRQVRLPIELVQRFPHQVSGGQRQRVGIARALAPGPSALIADEAVSALDAPVRAEVLGLFAQLQRDLGLGLLFISHDIATVARIAHRIAVMYQGRIVEHGPTQAVLARPAHGYTRMLLDVAAQTPGHLADRIEQTPPIAADPGPDAPSVYRRVGENHFVLVP